MAYYTTWADFGDPIRTSILKKISSTVFGTSDQIVTYKWGFDYTPQSLSEQVSVDSDGTLAEYGIAEYGIGEYGTGLTTDTISVNSGGSGKVIQVGLEIDIDGAAVSIQRLDVYTKDGAYK
jgi:hypothetical protein